VLYNLQTLRALAASGVVIYHSQATFFGLSTEFHGVALFFVLSGYLMCRICDRSALDFVSDRFWRIVPNYWLATAFLLSLFHMWTYWPAEHTLLSALFIPHASATGLHPVLDVGWTLNMEMYFYSVFALSICVSRSFAPIVSGAAIMAIWFGLPYLTDNKAACFYFTHQYISYFVIGIVIWYFTECIRTRVSKHTFPRWLFPFSVLMYVASVLLFDTGIVGVSLLLVVSVLAANQGADIKNRTLLLLGNASYACYLLHTIIIEFLRQHGVATSGTLLFTTSVLVGSWVLAIVWYFSVERFVSLLRQLTVFQVTHNDRDPFGIRKIESSSL